MLFVFLATIHIPVPVAHAVDSPEARLDSRPAGAVQFVFGNEIEVAVKISGVTDAVYEQVHEHEATVHFDPNELELVRIPTIDDSYFHAPESTELSPGVVKTTHTVKSAGNPYAFSGGAEKSFSVFVFKSKIPAASNPVVTVSDIYITNGQGDKLKLNDVSYTVHVVPAGDKTALRALVSQAQSVHDAAVEGSAPGQYPIGSKNTLQAAITQADQFVKEGSAEYSEQELNTAQAELQTALSAFTASVIGQPESGSLPDGEYNIGFTIYKKGTDEPSVMYDYVDRNSGKLKVQGGKKLVSFTLKQSAETLSFKTERDGILVETTTVSRDEAANTRVVQFEVDDLSARLAGWVKVYWVLPPPIGVYDHEYEVDLGFSDIAAIVNKTQLNALIADAQSKHDAAVEGSAAGQYPAGAKSALQAAINQAKATAENPAATQQQVDQAVTALQTALTAFTASVISHPGGGSLPDGEYNIGFTIYKKGTDEPSVMYDYVDRNSGKLKVQGGKKLVSFTLKQSAETLSFKTERDGILVETTTVSRDEAANTRVVQFEVDDLSARLAGWVKVYWVLPPPIGVYDHEYEVDLGFSDIAAIVNKTQLNALIADAQSKHDAAVEGSAAGQYPAGAKSALQAAINQAKATAENPAATQQQVDQAVTALQTALSEFTASVIGHPGSGSLPDGVYTFEIVGTSEDESDIPLSSYMENTGEIKVENGKNIVSFKLKNGAAITKLQMLKSDGSTQDILPKVALKQSGVVSVLSAGESTTEAQFELEDLSASYRLILEVPQGEDKATRTFRIALGQINPVTSNPGTNPGGGTIPSNIHGIEDGTYSINYKILKYNTEQKSVMQDYVITPGTLTVTNGQMYASITLKQSKEVTGFRVADGDSLVDTEVMSVDEAKNTRVVRFKVADLTAKLKAWVKIEWPEFKYFHDYDIHITFDKSSLIPIDANGAKTTVKPFTEELEPGEYAIDFVINRRGTDQASVANDYVKHPAKLTVKDGKSYVALILNQSKEVPGFKVEVDGKLVNAEVIASSKEDNSRTVQFDVVDAETKIYAQIRMAVPDKYVGDYDVEILFDKDSIKTYVEEKKEPKEPKDPKDSDNADHPSGSSPIIEQVRLKDIEDHWAKALIERAVGLGIVNGYEDGTFRPERQVNRAEFMVMINRALKPKAAAAEPTLADFENIPEWIRPGLAQMVGSEVVRGYEDGTFRLDHTINRAELAVMMIRASRIPLASNAELTFADADQIPEWAKAEVATALSLGIMNVRDDQHFAPKASATRVEAVAYILAMMNQIK
ncbi:NEAT domain-containing protein [Paenibacillus naphthalenovorans]|uniref:NEAT domain-containing protein n=1 Tax=Paenibacillus naphthalenovorans TaxID=162209 RepID=UPI001587B5F1|nr:NEAT domain-containing protein [Paenibacillus naphthalenovorans]